MATPTNNKRLVLRLPRDLVARLAEAAHDADRTVSAEARRALRAWLAQAEREQRERAGAQ